MLEFLFGNFGHFIISVIIISALIPFLFSLGCVSTYAVTHFVTRGKAAIKPRSCRVGYFDKCPWNKAREQDYLFGMAVVGMMFYPMIASLIGMVLGIVLWVMPFFGWVALGSVAGVLFTARFAYTVYSKFDDHMKKLHKVSDSDEEYKAKW